MAKQAAESSEINDIFAQKTIKWHIGRQPLKIAPRWTLARAEKRAIADISLTSTSGTLDIAIS